MTDDDAIDVLADFFPGALGMTREAAMLAALDRNTAPPRAISSVERSLLTALAILDAKRQTAISANERTAAERLQTALLRGRAKGWDTACHQLANRACDLLYDHYREHPDRPQDDFRFSNEAARLIHGAITRAWIEARRQRKRRAERAPD